MVTGTDERIVTIYTIHNYEFTDNAYDIPEVLDEHKSDPCYDDYCECADDIGYDIREQWNEGWEHKVKIKIIYTKDYNYEHGIDEYDMEYSYEILESKLTDFWWDNKTKTNQ